MSSNRMVTNDVRKPAVPRNLGGWQTVNNLGEGVGGQVGRQHIGHRAEEYSVMLRVIVREWNPGGKRFASQGL